MFYGPERSLSWWMSKWVWEHCVVCCCMKSSINVNLIQLIDDAVQFNYVLAFLPAGSVNYWERGVKVVSYNLSFSSFSSIGFLLIYFDTVLLGTYTLRIGISFLHHYIIPLYIWSFFILNCALSEIHHSSFYLINVNAILHSFTFNLCISKVGFL